MNQIFYDDVIGVFVRRDVKKGHREGGGVCQGIALVTYDKKEVNRLKVPHLNLFNIIFALEKAPCKT